MKSKDKVFQIAEEIAFVKVLASNDTSLRNRALKKLYRWIAAKSQNPSTAFTDDDFIRLWEGLFFCMWMSDKPLIQEECAETISNLIHAFATEESALSFIRSFYHSMCCKWSSIDVFRLDKFAMLVRRFSRQSLVLSKKNGWNDKLSQEFSLFINKPTLPQGLFFHFCDIIIEEICKVADDQLNDDILILFMRPFFKKLAETKYRPLAAYMKETVIKSLIDLTDVADEYREKFKIWQQSGFKGGHINVIEKVDDQDDDEEVDEDMVDTRDLDTSLDPRPGCVDVMLPVIKIDPERYIQVLQEIKKEINRKSDNLSKLFTKFSSLKRGDYPYGLKKVKRGPSLKDDIDAAVEKMVNQKLGEGEESDGNEEEIEEEKGGKRNRKKLKRKRNEQKEDEQDDLGDIMAGKKGHWSITKGVDKKQTQSKVNNSQAIKQKSIPTKDQWNVISVTNQKETKKRKDFSTNSFTTDNVQTWKVEQSSKSSNENNLSSRQNLNLLKDSGECWWKVSRVDSCNQETQDDIQLNISSGSPQKQINTNSKKSPKSSAVNGTSSLDSDNDSNTLVLYNGQPIDSVLTVPNKLKHMTSSQQKTVAYPSMKQKGDVEVKSNQETKVTPLKPQNVRVSELKTPGRRLSIRLDMNTSQDVEEHLATLASNPKVPFDAEKKPIQGVLKPSPIPSPINPFYKKRRLILS
uniref:Ribosomal RNA processing protein 1 homolog n=1 Tax=Cacopsylla melanoneura TaxID=428564 RepID=A0A8D8ZI70_9HEMI